MSEEKEEKKEGEQPTDEDTKEGDKPEVYKPIDDANLAAKRLEEANKEKRELLDREEELLAKRALGGSTEAGAAPVKPKEPTAEEFAERALRGEDVFFKDFKKNE